MTMEIGIVGGGASAVCLIAALTQLDLSHGGLTVYEPSPHLWRGRPFQPDLDSVRVNAPPEEMSVFAGDPGHFGRWLNSCATRTVTPDPYSGSLFPPRARYGDYLAETATTALDLLRQRGWRVEVVRSAVTAARRARDRMVLRTAYGRHHALDYAVLCFGGGRPQDVYGLTGERGFVADPYPLRATLRQIGPDDPVTVLGCGLTAVDVVLGLARTGHTGPIAMVSRSGLLPGVRQRVVDHELRHFTPQRLRHWATTRDRVELADLVALMRRELAEAGPGAEAEVRRELAANGTEPAPERLRRQLSEVNSPDLGLRILQRAVPDAGPDVWPLLDGNDRARLLGPHYRTIMSLCCPMPPASAAALLELMDRGQLTVGGGLMDIRPHPAGGFDVTAGSGSFRTAHVVNATSSAPHRIPPAAGALVHSLEADGAAIRHPRGGLRLERATSRIVSIRGADPRLYGVGDIAAGELFFTFGVPSLVDRAVDVAASIADAEHPTVTRAMPVGAGVA